MCSNHLSTVCVVMMMLSSFLFVFQEKQNEALYLREHRGELVEELAKTIVEKVQKTIIKMTQMELDDLS